MRSGERLGLFLKIITPLVILAWFGVRPASVAVSEGLFAARMTYASNRHQDTAAAFRQVLQHESWRTGLWEQIGREEKEAAHPRQAIEAFEQAKTAGVLSMQGEYLLGQASLEAGDPVAAESAWKELLENRAALPGDLAARTYADLAQVQRERGAFREAAETLSAWHDADPQNTSATYLLGLQLSVIDPEAGLDLLIQAASQDPAYSNTVQKIRRGVNTAGESDNPGYSWLIIGRALGNAGQWDLAAEAFRQALVSAPEYAEAWAFQGEAKMHLGRDGQADYDRALDLDPESPVVRALMALNYRRAGNYDLALEQLSTVAALEPDEPMWEIELGYTWAEKGDLPIALEHFQKATEMAPQSSIYWQYLARFSVEYGVNISIIGLPAARKAVVLSPDDPAALDMMGWIMVNLADYASAERFLQQAVEKDATYPSALLHLGQLYLQKEDLERAYPYLKRAALLAGEDPVGLVAKRLLLRYFGGGG